MSTNTQNPLRSELFTARTSALSLAPEVNVISSLITGSQSLVNLERQLSLFLERQFTGRLDLKVITGRKWSLYLTLGRLAWAEGGIHPVRRWKRQLTKIGLIGILGSLKLRQKDRFECWDYEILTLLAQRKLATTEQVVAAIEGTVTEVLFEILQELELAAIGQDLEESLESFQLKEKGEIFQIRGSVGARPSHSDTGILPHHWAVDLDQVFTQAKQQWEQWLKVGLGTCSPNLAPSLCDLEQLRQHTGAQACKNLVELANGKRTLWDLGVLLKTDAIQITRSLLPYIRHQWISLKEVEDLPKPQFNLSPNPALTTTEEQQGERRSKVKGRVVCIDDSSQVCEKMEELIKNAGYEIIAIQEAIHAVPTLIQNKPDLIFLDLVMPIASGYEICSQIRRVSLLKDTPVIVLTGNDGIIDRVRAKMVGATDFMSKPVQGEKVLGAIEKYLHKKTTVCSESG